MQCLFMASVSFLYLSYFEFTAINMGVQIILSCTGISHFTWVNSQEWDGWFMWQIYFPTCEESLNC